MEEVTEKKPTQDFRFVLKIVDITFGSFTFLYTLTLATHYYLTNVGGLAIVAILSFIIFNLTISQFSAKSSAPALLEYFRQIFAICIICPFAIYATREIITPFWQLYLIMVVSSGSLLFEVTSKYTPNILTVILGITSFLLSCFFFLDAPNWTDIIIQSLTIIMLNMLFTKFLILVNKSYQSEVERTIQLETTMKELKNIQESLIYSSRMTAIGEMAAGIAHEINNPLAIINGSVFQLNKIESGNKEVDSTLATISHRISETVSRITKIILSLKTVSRDATGTKQENASLKEILADATAIFAERFKVNGIDLIINEKEFESCPQIFVDHVQLSQVLINLLNNAYDAVETLPNPWVKIEVGQDNLFHILKICDSGKGIPPKIKEKIFEPFYTSKEIGKGTGLGLSISRGLIEKNGGELYIDSNSPNTCFVIKIPKL